MVDWLVGWLVGCLFESQLTRENRFTTQMFHTMTFQGAGGFLGGIGFLLTIVPWVLLLYGPKIRAKSRLAREII